MTTKNNTARKIGSHKMVKIHSVAITCVRKNVCLWNLLLFFFQSFRKINAFFTVPIKVVRNKHLNAVNTQTHHMNRAPTELQCVKHSKRERDFGVVIKL